MSTHITGVVDEARGISVHCSVHDSVIIYTEHVAADALSFVLLLTDVTHG